MKKLMYILSAATIVLASQACTAKSDAAEATETTEATEVTDAASGSTAQHDAVEVLTDVDAYAPGAKVEQLTVIDFSAVWCGPCRQFAPVFDATAAKYAGKAKFLSCDLDEHTSLANAYGIQAIPTVLLLRLDGTYETYTGLGDIMPAEKFEALIEKNL